MDYKEHDINKCGSTGLARVSDYWGTCGGAEEY